MTASHCARSNQVYDLVGLLGCGEAGDLAWAVPGTVHHTGRPAAVGPALGTLEVLCRLSGLRHALARVRGRVRVRVRVRIYSRFKLSLGLGLWLPCSC